MTKLPERLRVIRKERRESGDIAASRLGKKQSTWSAWELGKSEPNANDIATICKEYGVSSDWLLGITDNRVTITNGDGSAVAVGDGSTASAGDAGKVAFLEQQLAAANEEKSRLLAIISNLTTK